MQLVSLSSKTSFPWEKQTNKKKSCFLLSYKALQMNRGFDNKYAFFEM